MSSKRAGEAGGTSCTAKKQCTKPSRQNWKAGLKTPVDRLTEIYKSSRLTDLTISFPGSREKLKVHRLMLAMTSPVFECMLYGPLAEGKELELPEDPLDAFKWLLQYIYCGITDFPDISTAIQVYLLAHKYQIDDLLLLCSQWLQEILDEDNLHIIYPTASFLEDKDLLQACDMIMTYSSELMLSSPSIELVNREYMKNFIERELSVRSEVAVYNGLIKWGRAQDSQATAKAESKGLREIVNEFLPFVNFLSMSLDEYVEHVGPSNVVTSNESLAILMNIKKVENVPLPEFCTQVGRRHSWCINEAHTVPLATLQSNVYSIAEHVEHCRHQMIADLVEPVLSRQQIISNLKINKNICMHSIELCFGLPVKPSKWVIEVTYSSGKVIRKVKLDYIRRADNKVIASFTPPLLLRPRKLYNIWIYSTLNISKSKEFCVQHSDFKFTGSIRQEVGAKLQFGDFKERPNDVSDSNSNGGDNRDGPSHK